MSGLVSAVDRRNRCTARCLSIRYCFSISNSHFFGKRILPEAITASGESRYFLRTIGHPLCPSAVASEGGYETLTRRWWYPHRCDRGFLAFRRRTVTRSSIRVFQPWRRPFRQHARRPAPLLCRGRVGDRDGYLPGNPETLIARNHPPSGTPRS